MSATTWALQLAGIFIFVIYNVRMGYPVSTYLDFAALSVQATILLTLICVFQNHFFARSGSGRSVFIRRTACDDGKNSGG